MGRRMHGFAGILVICLSLALPQCASASDLTPGMSEHEVAAVMGPPDAIRLERNAVVCLTYGTHEHTVWSRVFGRIRVIALKENSLVDDTDVRPGNVRHHCSRIAGRWDPYIPRASACDDQRAPRCAP